MASVDTISAGIDRVQGLEVDPIDRWEHGAVTGWAGRVVEQLRRIAALEANWDGEGALPVSPAAIQRAVQLVAILILLAVRWSPHVNPTRSGGIQFEWETDRGYLEVEIERDGAVTAFLVDGTTGAEREVQLSDLRPVQALLDLLREVHRA